MVNGPGRKPSEQRERRFVQDYVWNAYPDYPKFFNERLGGIPEKLAGMFTADLSPNIAKPWARYADALVLAPDRVILVEAKLPAKAEAVAQLMFYRGLVAKTPKFANYVSYPVEMVMVTAMADPELVLFAEAHGVRVVVFQPDYALEYLGKLLKGRVSKSGS